MPIVDQSKLFLKICSNFFPEIEEKYKNSVILQNIALCKSHRELKISYLQPITTYMNTISSFEETEQQEFNILCYLCIINKNFNQQFRIIKQFNFKNFNPKNNSEIQNFVDCLNDFYIEILHLKADGLSTQNNRVLIHHLLYNIFELSKSISTTIRKLDDKTGKYDSIKSQYEYNNNRGATDPKITKMAQDEILFEILKKITELSFFI